MPVMDETILSMASSPNRSGRILWIPFRYRVQTSNLLRRRPLGVHVETSALELAAAEEDASVKRLVCGAFDYAGAGLQHVEK